MSTEIVIADALVSFGDAVACIRDDRRVALRGYILYAVGDTVIILTPDGREHDCRASSLHALPPGSLRDSHDVLLALLDHVLLHFYRDFGLQPAPLVSDIPLRLTSLLSRAYLVAFGATSTTPAPLAILSAATDEPQIGPAGPSPRVLTICPRR